MLNETEYAQIKASIRSWSPEQDKTFFKEVDIRPCTRQELGLDPDAMDTSKFYKTHPSSEAYLSRYWKKLSCYDEQVDIQGDYQSDRASNLMINVVRCNNATRREDEPPCKSEQEITSWLKRKFVLTLNNQRRFEQSNYDQGTVVYDVAHFVWNPIQSTERKEIVNEIRVYEIQAQDSLYIHAYELTKEIFSAFNIVI